MIRRAARHGSLGTFQTAPLAPLTALLARERGDGGGPVLPRPRADQRRDHVRLHARPVGSSTTPIRRSRRAPSAAPMRRCNGGAHGADERRPRGRRARLQPGAHALELPGLPARARARILTPFQPDIARVDSGQLPFAREEPSAAELDRAHYQALMDDPKYQPGWSMLRRLNRENVRLMLGVWGGPGQFTDDGTRRGQLLPSTSTLRRVRHVGRRLPRAASSTSPSGR